MNQYHFNVSAADVDYRDRIHWHSLFGMLQEAAGRNAEEYDWGASSMDAHAASWIILRMSVRMRRLPKFCEQVSIATWSRGYRRLYFLRDFIISDGEGVEIGSATSVWIAVDKGSRRPLRPERFDAVSAVASVDRKALFEEALQIEPLSKRPSVKEESVNKILKYADFSEIDRNFHVNNTRYVAWSMDAANFMELMKCDILSIDINYLCEIKHKDKVDIVFASEGPEIRVDGIVSQTGKLAFCCRLSSEEYIGGSA
jgi:acyl-ACP thioesterase